MTSALGEEATIRGDRRLPVRRASATRSPGALRDVVLCHCAMCRRTHGHVGAYTAAARRARARPSARTPVVRVVGGRRGGKTVNAAASVFGTASR